MSAADRRPLREPRFYKCSICGFFSAFDRPQHDCYWVLRDRAKSELSQVLRDALASVARSL